MSNHTFCLFVVRLLVIVVVLCLHHNDNALSNVENVASHEATEERAKHIRDGVFECPVGLVNANAELPGHALPQDLGECDGRVENAT